MRKEKIVKQTFRYNPKGVAQQKYCQYLENADNSIIVAIGPAGTGKTMFACLKAIQLLKKGELSKIVITRPAVTVEEEIGFLPGNIAKKMDPWTRPIFDIFNEVYSKTDIDNMIYSNVIEISPLAYMRGRTFKNSFIIADEMQNSSPNQMMMLTTRLGVNSRMVITGDVKQSDIKKENGLTDFVNKLNIFYNFNSFTNQNCSIKLVELNSTDVERSEVVKKVIDIYDFKCNETVQPIKNKTFVSNLPNYVTEKPKQKVKKNIVNESNDNDAALIPLHHETIVAKTSHFKKIWEE